VYNIATIKSSNNIVYNIGTIKSINNIVYNIGTIKSISNFCFKFKKYISIKYNNNSNSVPAAWVSVL
jgi:hypothetical protein